MKKRPATTDPGPAAIDAVVEALGCLADDGQRRAFLEDLCTPAELQALADRWRVVPLLLQGLPYREIHDLTGVSVTTVGRVARCIEFGAGGYRAAAEQLGLAQAETDASH